MSTQTIKDGTIMRFNTMHMGEDLLECLEGKTIEDVENYHGQPVKVLYLETYTHLGDRDYEYYTVKFEDGFVMDGLSGYHLEDIPKQSLTQKLIDWWKEPIRIKI